MGTFDGLFTSGGSGYSDNTDDGGDRFKNLFAKSTPAPSLGTTTIGSRPSNVGSIFGGSTQVNRSPTTPMTTIGNISMPKTTAVPRPLPPVSLTQPTPTSPSFMQSFQQSLPKIGGLNAVGPGAPGAHAQTSPMQQFRNSLPFQNPHVATSSAAPQIEQVNRIPGQVGGFLANMAQSIPRDVVGTYESLTGKDNYQPQGIGRFLLGNEPVPNLTSAGRNTANTAGTIATLGGNNQFGSSLNPALNTAIGVGSAGLDLLGLGGLARGAVKGALGKTAEGVAGKVAADIPRQPFSATMPASKFSSFEPTDRATVDAYKQQIQSGKPVEPLLVKPDSMGSMGIEDGKHRFQAFKELGMNNVPIRLATPSGSPGVSGMFSPSVARAANASKEPTLAEISAQGATRPPSQKVIEDALNKGDYQTAKTTNDALPATDPYKSSNEKLIQESSTPVKPQSVNMSKLPKTGAETPSEGPGNLTLNAGVNPGLDKLISQDIVPKAQGALQGAKNVIGDLKGTLAPSSADDNALLTSLAVRKFKATSANDAAIEVANGKVASKFFNKQPDAANVSNISSYERAGKFANEPVKGYSDIFKASTDYAHNLNQQTFGKNDLGYIDNYVRRNWQFGNEADAQKATTALLNSSRSLQPSMRNLGQRTLTMPLDEAQKVLDAQGIKAKLMTTNPEELRQATVASAERAAAYKTMGEELKANGQISFVKPGQTVPEGMVPLKDRAFQTFFPSEAGMVKAGQYYAPTGAARILNNAVSTGLEGNAIFRGLRQINNTLNQTQLGLSAFHAGTETINSSLNDMALGVRSLFGGHPQGLLQLGRGLVPGASIARSTYLGSKAFAGFRDANPESAKLLQEMINPSGFRLRMDQNYKTSITDNLVHAAINGNYLGAIARVPGAAIETLSKPIMEHLVPNAKLGAMLDRVKSIQERMPNATDAQLSKELAKASDSIDNIYGQLVYDNLFWNKATKDIAMLSQRSVGWNLGTVREIGGGIKDLGTQTLRGKGVSDRTLYSAMLPVLVGLYGATYQYLHTGKGPQSLLDYFYPKTGLTNKAGNPDRVALPSYMKDVFSYGKDPFATVAHKLSPGLGAISDLMNNKDYFGNLIRNPKDPVGKQLEQAASYVGKSAIPFSVQQFGKQKAAGGSAEQQAESFVGITPASGSITKSSFEQTVGEAVNKVMGSKTLTPEEQILIQDKAAAKEAARQGDKSQLDQLVKSGQITALGEKHLQTAASRTGLQNQFDLLFTRDKVAAADVLKNASPDDIKALGDTHSMMLSAANEMRNPNALPANRDAAKQIIGTLGGDPNNTKGLYQEYLRGQKQAKQQNASQTRQKSITDRMFKRGVQ